MVVRSVSFSGVPVSGEPFRQPIPVLILADRKPPVWPGLIRGLREVGTRLIPIPTWDEFRNQCSPVGIVVCDPSQAHHLLTEFERYEDPVNPRALVAVLTSGAQLREKRGLRDFLFLAEGSQLPVVLQQAVKWVDIARLKIEALEGTGSPIGRAFVRLILNSVEPIVSDPLPHTLLAVAVRLGCCSRTLQRLGHGTRTNPSAAIRFALLARACWSREVYGWSWDRIAFRLGYEGLSGLSELSRRTIGGGVRTLSWRVAVRGLREAVGPDP
jgi:AraC-like DNA-binding protein